jgi:protein-disulfide isomerase
MARLFFRAVLAAAPLLMFACSAESNNASSNTDANTDKAASNTSNAAEVMASDMVMGADDAPITIIEYASTTCPHCATFHETIFPAIKEKYVDTGKVKFVFREFPTAPVDYSMIGSVLARCAGEKGGDEAYFLVLGSLFKNQRAWVVGDNPKLELLRIAAQAGMNEEAFDACLKRQDFIDLVAANTETAQKKFSINSTPSFVMDGEKMSARTFEEFEAVLDAKLAQ